MSPTKQLIAIRIVLEKPVKGVDYALQTGKASKSDIVQKQSGTENDLVFEFDITIQLKKDNSLDFTGPFVQGPLRQRFFYINSGTQAGQKDSIWSRRLKIPLTELLADAVLREHSGEALTFKTIVPGTSKDGGPNCATVKPFNGWELFKKERRS